MSDIEGYEDFIVADNEVETATPSIKTETSTEEVDTETEGTIEPTETVENTDVKEKTETQRVSQRINEARQHGVDAHIAKQGYIWNDKPITTEAQYNQAMEEQAEQLRNAELEEKGIDPKYLNDAVENNPTVKQAKALLAEQATEKAKQQGYNDFIREFPDVKSESITQETWEMVNNGMSLVDAYSKQENKELKAKLKVYTQNETNKLKAPGKGVTTHGSDEVASEDDFMAGFNSIR